MNKSALFALLGAGLTALLVGLLVHSRLQSGGDTGQQRQVTHILVAKGNLPPGATLSPDNTMWQAWPSQLPPQAVQQGVTAEKAWAGKQLRRALSKGEPITAATLVVQQNGSLLAATLNPHMRAVAIEVRADSGVAGFLAPGDFVDVVLTYPMRIQGSVPEATQNIAIENAAETIIDGARVLAVDQDATATDRTPKVVKTVTLEVSKTGAEKLALARKMGDVHLALRRLGEAEEDTKLNAKKPAAFTTDTTMLQVNQAAIQARAATSPGSTGAAIRVYHGGNVQAVPVQGAAAMPAQTEVQP